MMKWLLPLLLMLSMQAVAQQSCRLPPQVTTLTNAQLQSLVAPASTRYPADGYLLALSWSPAFCAKADNNGRSESDSDFQCLNNHFGFVVHGLWPDSSAAPSIDDQPSFCRPVQPIAVATLKQHLCTVPGVRLMHHEWAKHGSCAFKSPEAYFDTIERLRRQLRTPDFSGPRSATLSAGDIRQAFMQRNLGLSHESIMIVTDRKNRLEEVRICYDTSFRTTRCQRRGAPDRILIRISTFLP